MRRVFGIVSTGEMVFNRRVLTEKPWRPELLLRFLMMTFIGMFGFLVVQSGLTLAFGKNVLSQGSLTYLIFTSLVIHGSILIGVGLTLHQGKIPWSAAFGFVRAHLGKTIMLGLGCGIVFLPLGMFLQRICITVLDKFNVKSSPQAAIQEFNQADSIASKAYLAFFAILLAPVAEEICFRGILYPAIKQLGFPRAAWWGTAILFAAIHLSLPIFVPLMALSLLLTWVYEQTDNLIAPIIAHATFNSINVYLLLFTDLMQNNEQAGLIHRM